jgi:menaquinone-9 beta-reductase
MRAFASQSRDDGTMGVRVKPYDVVVVGAGPAGSAAAIGAVLAGWRVLLLDKATFPRDKVCGDFLSPRSLNVLEALGCGPAVKRAQPQRVETSVLYLDGKQVSVGTVPKVGGLPGYGLVVPRASLDELLFRRAEEAGATTVEGFEAHRLSVAADGVTVEGRGRTGARRVSGRLVILADGARSRLDSSVGLVPRDGKKDLFALRAYYTGVGGDPGTAAIFFDAAYFPGYAWLFPIGAGRANVGMGMIMDVSKHYGINLRERFMRWLEEDPGVGERLRGASLEGRIVGWPLSTYRGDHGNYAERVLVVGDAGHFVDPINGEGIHTALETARLAASVADEALREDDLSAASLSRYEHRWRAAFDLDLRTSDLMVTVVKNRSLLPFWLLIIRMIAERSLVDQDFASRCGGILAGVIPSHQGMSPELAAKTLLQRPGFWLRNRGEVRQALKALLTPDIGGGLATGGTRDLERESAYAIGWTLDVMLKTWRVSEGLAKTYGVPWAVTQRRSVDIPLRHAR